jgi:MFS family permease
MRHPLSFRDYRFFCCARLCSTLAQNCMIVVLGWQVYEIARRTHGIKGASLQLGLIGLAQFLPLFALALVAGWVADYVDRRFVARGCISLQLVSASALTLLSLSSPNWLAPFFIVAIGLGIARAFSGPALNALAPQLVPPEVLPKAIAINAIGTRAGSIAGPALGGYLYAVSPAAPYVASVALFAVTLTCLFLLRPLPPVAVDRTMNPWRQMVEGLAYATAIWFSWRPLGQKSGVKMLVAVGIYGLATAIFGLSRSLPLSLACLVVLGAADMLSVFVRQSLIQLSTPNAMRGRVGAVSSLFVSASNELGEAESGFVAALIGPVAAVVGGGIAAIAISMLWARLFPALRKTGDLADTALQPR